jgi:hypothetical protein
MSAGRRLEWVKYSIYGHATRLLELPGGREIIRRHNLHIDHIKRTVTCDGKERDIDFWKITQEDIEAAFQRVQAKHGPALLEEEELQEGRLREALTLHSGFKARVELWMNSLSKSSLLFA